MRRELETLILLDSPSSPVRHYFTALRCGFWLFVLLGTLSYFEILPTSATELEPLEADTRQSTSESASLADDR